MRFRAYYKNLSVANPSSAPFGSSGVSGIGDFDARILAIASASSSFILAPGLVEWGLSQRFDNANLMLNFVFLTNLLDGR